MRSSLVYRIQELAIALEKRFDKLLKKEFGISYSQYKVMSVVELKHGCSQRMIAEILNQTEASVSRQANLLITAGLILNDKTLSLRTKTLMLSEKGEKMLTESTAYLEEAQAQITGSLAYQEQKLVSELIDRMFNKAAAS